MANPLDPHPREHDSTAGGAPIPPAPAPGSGGSGSGPSRPSIIERARARKEQLTSRTEDVLQRAEDARPRSAIIDAMFGSVEHDSTIGGTILAGAVAFRLFLVLVPYVFVLVVALGFTVSDETSSQDLAQRMGISGIVAAAVAGTGDISTWQRISALVVGGFALLWATRTALKVLRGAHYLIWGMRPVRQPTVKPVLVSLGLIALLAVGALLVRRLEDINLLLGLAAMAGSVVIPAAIWLVASIHLPHGDAPWWALLPGAAIFGVGVEVLHFITVYWIAREVESKSDMYGAIGTALALLLWSYILGRIITFGAVVNASLWQRHRQLTAPRPGPPGPGSPGPGPGPAPPPPA